MKKQYFGTDGIRGRVGQPPITPEDLLKLGMAFGQVFCEWQGAPGEVLIGWDTRASSDMLVAALSAGLVNAGMSVGLVGVLPTPAVSHLMKPLGAEAGLMVSASHNPYTDNGVKFFTKTGYKLSDAFESAIEQRLRANEKQPTADKPGRIRWCDGVQAIYQDFCCQSFSEHTLQGMKIVLDCANGATFGVAPALFKRLGADVTVIHHEPDGYNINAHCGSTSPQSLCEAVLNTQSDVGIAFDGDGDRVILVDHTGQILDGDKILAIIACDLKSRNQLTGGVAGTVMTNEGIARAFQAADIPFVRAPVGDRYVLEALRAREWLLGGEASGHVLCLEYASSGDAIIAALQVLKVMKLTSASLYDLAAQFKVYPQVLLNLPMRLPEEPMSYPAIQNAVMHAEAALQGSGRVLVRRSGTEPVVRVMVEGPEQPSIEHIAKQLAGAIKQHILAD